MQINLTLFDEVGSCIVTRGSFGVRSKAKTKQELLAKISSQRK